METFILPCLDKCLGGGCVARAEERVDDGFGEFRSVVWMRGVERGE
jgi:hypothetical protein